MTMLIAGHETTAAVLTWALFELTRNPDCMKQARDEIDSVLGDREPTYEGEVQQVARNELHNCVAKRRKMKPSSLARSVV